MAVTNEEFAQRVGCHFTMASRMRNGTRLPSVRLLIRMSREFELPIEQLIESYADGPQAFAEFLRVNVFNTLDRPELVA